mmetsp:Transcript_8709/g.24324  ORF Transcript_8709/g.24324 Transcript_8709/m.24324 type:complete len:151 (-) Transcript_8709:169-621(-)|eukprot:CAMPEP_0194480634 /NCGR_PEP_ID=MMETSP0253-20130528/3372_1 /TAXON_ID=2966 /ORGANISM="Noctiluca scintillans" /LENGTH=150 /DNA_ID=CAMNT_0039320043 /DNA_START=32 /DNA_END=484 /DNA_ORIENTATION=+
MFQCCCVHDKPDDALGGLVTQMPGCGESLDASTLGIPDDLPDQSNSGYSPEDPAMETEIPVGGEYLISIDRSELGHTGLRVVQKSNSLTVRAVKSGVVEQWNAAHPQRCVRVGDLLVEVNGVRGAASTVVEKFKADAALNLVFKRTSASK